MFGKNGCWKSQRREGIVLSQAWELWNRCGSHTSLEQRHLPTPPWIPGWGERTHTQPVPVQGAAIPGYPGTSSGIALAPRAPHGAPHTDTGTRLRPLPQAGEAEFLEALRQGWECRDEAAGAAGMGSCSPGLGICPGTRSPWMHKQPGRERDEAGREQGLAALGVKGN